MASSDLRAWLPVRQPTWLDVLVAALAAFWLVFDWGPVEPTPWAWLGIGFALPLVALGPAGRSSAGRAVGERVRESGMVGRAAAILPFAFAVRRVDATVGLPRAPVDGIAAGPMLGVLASVALSLLPFRRIGDARPT